MNNNDNSPDTGRIGWLERDGDDFPFYDGRPVALNFVKWIVVLLGVALAFYVLTHGFGPAVPTLRGFLPAIAYTVIPLIALAIVAKGHWKALFRKVTGRDVLLMIGFAILTIAVTVASSLFFIDLESATANPGVAAMAEDGAAGIVLFYLKAAVQLVGEELMTILPFLFLLWLFVSKMKMGRVTGIVLAWLATAVLFAAEHLPTYDWNVVQTLAGVGVARLVLTLPYIMTKNLWVAAGAHILNDWLMFLPAVISATAGAPAG